MSAGQNIGLHRTGRNGPGEPTPDPADASLDPADIRTQLRAILSEAKNVENVSWKAARLDLYRLLYNQLTSRLPEDEAERLRTAMEAELERL